MPHDSRCIAVFDSGLGGLTVVHALRQRLPAEDLVYFGDTARVPYGTKSPETVVRFAREDCDFLLRFNPKMLVVACNTASAAALPDLESSVPVPIAGVVRPGAAAATRLAQGRRIAVIATEATVNSNAYKRAIRELGSDAPVVQRACPLFVPCVEEGRDAADAIVQAIAREYLQPLIPLSPAVMILGCTHYPLLRQAIATVMGPDVALVDSGDETARGVEALLREQSLLAKPGGTGTLTCYVSDNPQRLREVGQRFLGEPIRDVTCVSPEEFHAGESAHV